MRTKRTMYNQDQKDKYLEIEKNNVKTLETYFRRFSEQEQKCNKDISIMNEEELKTALLSLNIRREESRGHLLSLLKGYIDWTRLNGLSNSNAIDQMSAISLYNADTVKNQMIKDLEQLENILENTLDEVGYENRTYRDSLVFYLLYDGLSVDKIASLKKEDINFSKMIIHIGEKEHQITNDKIKNLWPKVVNMTTVERKNGKSETNEFMRYDLVSNDFLFRQIACFSKKSSDGCTINSFIKIVSDVTKASNKDAKITPENVRISGIFYRLLNFERSGVIITPETIAKFFELDYKDQNDLQIKMRKWLIDYEDWKIAFGHMND